MGATIFIIRLEQWQKLTYLAGLDIDHRPSLHEEELPSIEEQDAAAETGPKEQHVTIHEIQRGSSRKQGINRQVYCD